MGGRWRYRKVHLCHPCIMLLSLSRQCFPNPVLYLQGGLDSSWRKSVISNTLWLVMKKQTEFYIFVLSLLSCHIHIQTLHNFSLRKHHVTDGNRTADYQHRSSLPLRLRYQFWLTFNKYSFIFQRMIEVL